MLSKLYLTTTGIIMQSLNLKVPYFGILDKVASDKVASDKVASDKVASGHLLKKSSFLRKIVSNMAAALGSLACLAAGARPPSL